MPDIKILHFSDLHFSNNQKTDIDIVFNAFINDLKKIALENQIAPNIVIFSGDIVQAGDDTSLFDTVYEQFLTKMMKILGLNMDRLFLTPGNHDIQRSMIQDFIEKGLRQTLKDESNVNEFIDDFQNNIVCFQQLNNYFSFIQKHKTENTISSNILFSTHALQIENTKIGIACLNSAWRASGGPDNIDHGKLLIGERQIDLAVNDIQKSDLKIAVIHHPLEWINPFETSIIRRRLYHEFDIICFGHNHDPNPELVDSSHSSVLISHSGSLYQTREYYNGYSIIKYDSDTNRGVVNLRSYFDNRRKFDKAIDYIEEGLIEFELNNSKRQELIPYIEKSNFEEVILKDANANLLSSTISSNAPKNILDLFVSPSLSKKSERTKQSEIVKSEKEDDKEKDRIVPQELIKDTNNYLIIGSKESGKTTLLKWLCVNAIQNEDENSRIPFYINFQELPSGKPIDAFQKAMLLYSFNQDCTININFDYLLKVGKVIIFIDDFDFRTTSKVKKLEKFIEKYPLNKYMVILNEDYDFSFTNKDSVDIVVHFKKIYLQVFNRNRIRLLIKNWFTTNEENCEQILEKVTQHLKDLNIPTYPVVISLLLWIWENNPSYYPHNKASLLEKFIENILEKNSLQKAQNFHLDYQDREHYLTFIVEYMVNCNQYFFHNRLALEKLTIEYFSMRGLTISTSQFIDYFFNRGVFVELKNEAIQFKYKCFCEYFIAKQMILKDSFYSQIAKEKDHIGFINEIDIFTGLKRNDRHLVNIIENNVRKIFEDSRFDIPLDTFEKIECQDALFDNECTKELINLSDDMADEDRDDLIEGTVFFDKPVQATSLKIPSQEINKNRSETEEEVPFEFMALNNLILLSRTIRNSEHIESLEYRQSVFDSCIEYWAKMLLFMNRRLIQDYESKDKEAEDKEAEDIEKIKKVIEVSVPIAIQSLILDNIGSNKMLDLIKTGICRHNEMVKAILYVSLYTDLSLPGYVPEIQKIIKNANKFVLELFYIKLHFIYLLKKLSPNQKDQILNLIVEIDSRRTKGKIKGKYNKVAKGITKAKLAKELNTKRIALSHQE